MKKTCKILILTVVAGFLLAAAAIPALAAEGFDFESAIEDFVPEDDLNTYTLEIGEKHSPFAAIWAQNGGASCYSSDKSVVTVSARGTVTAVGEGTAYVAIVTVGGMYEMTRYDVVTHKGFHLDADVVFIIMLVVVLLIAAAGVVFILIEAPKYNMSRLWALFPVLGSVIGFIVFLIVRSERKRAAQSSANIVVCPSCGGIHLAGTLQCPICGWKLQ